MNEPIELWYLPGHEELPEKISITANFSLTPSVNGGTKIYEKNEKLTLNVEIRLEGELSLLNANYWEMFSSFECLGGQSDSQSMSSKTPFENDTKEFHLIEEVELNTLPIGMYKPIVLITLIGNDLKPILTGASTEFNYIQIFSQKET